MEFQMIRIAEDVLDGSAVDHGDEPGAFSEPFSELGVIQVPVALLAAGAKFRLYLGVDGALSVDESMQSVGIPSWLHAFQFALRAGGWSKNQQ